MNRLHTPILFLVLFQRGSWMNRLHTPILFLVLFWRRSWMKRTHPPRLLCLSSSATELHSLAKGPSGLRTATLSSTAGSPSPSDHWLLRHRPAQLLCRQPADRRICPGRPPELWICRKGLRAGRLNSGSARDGLQAGRLNSGSAGERLRASRLNSGSVGDALRAGRLNSCPPSEAPSAHPGRMYVLFLFCGRLGSASYLQTSSFRSSSPHIGPTRNPNMTDSGSGGMGSVL
ncbi:hypothetical protein GOODEAATRI_021280 [Goodea atripinnis]|uniref:Uncharacterized protein n=1 Tax=Goodea atripinnis TaxID=208336 RepID=A0ABV0NET2_9TELE